MINSLYSILKLMGVRAVILGDIGLESCPELDQGLDAFKRFLVAVYGSDFRNL